MLLANAHGSLLDDASLTDTLDASKASWESMRNSLQVRFRTLCTRDHCSHMTGQRPESAVLTRQHLHQAMETAMGKVEAAAAQYHPAAVHAAGLYFVMASLSKLSPMYAFGLPAYAELFAMSLARSARSERAEERVRHINGYHTYAVFRHACRCSSTCNDFSELGHDAVMHNVRLGAGVVTCAQYS